MHGDVFLGKMIPSYDERDVKALLHYFSIYKEAPPFISLGEIQRKQLDLTQVAMTIVKEKMTRSRQRAYIDELWSDPEQLFSIYFHKKLFFVQQLNIELRKVLKEEKGELYECV